jgi:hypothetical protein
MIRRSQGVSAILLYTYILIFFIFPCILWNCTSPSGNGDESKNPVVKVDASLLDFSETLDSLSFSVKITGGTTEWGVEGVLPEWCTATTEKTQSGGTVTVRINRASLSPGGYSTLLTVKWGTGSHKVEIKATVPQKPQNTGTIVIDVKVPQIEEKP